MEDFFYDEEFYSDIENLMSDLDLNTIEDVQNLEDDYSLECTKSIIEPIFTLSAQWILERIDEERFSESGNELDSLEKTITENIDFDKVNSLIPKLCYETKEKFQITKQDLLNEF